MKVSIMACFHVAFLPLCSPSSHAVSMIVEKSGHDVAQIHVLCVAAQRKSCASNE